MKIIIIGGGIGGLTAAVALSKVGADVQVYERAPELREVGAGIALASNALRALDVLGLAAHLQSSSIGGTQAAIRGPKGNVLTAVSPALFRKLGPVAIFHRAELLALLARHVDPTRLHLGRKFVGFEQSSGAVIARFDSGECICADGLIGADGLHSAVRTQLFGNQVIRYAGYTGWRAVTDFAASADAPPGETWGHGRRFGIVPMNRGRVYWFATTNTPPGERDPEGTVKERLAQLFRGWHQPIQELIAATPQESILRNDISDIDPLPRFVHGRVGLLGDAAHPMTPNLGQGACQAIEDSVVLAACLKTGGQVEGALQEYERRRMPRTNAIVIRARRSGVVAQLEHPALCWIRDCAMRLAPPELAVRQMKSISGAEILTPAERALFQLTGSSAERWPLHSPSVLTSSHHD